MRENGASAKFEFIHVISYHNERWWLCGIEGGIIQSPFALTRELKRTIRSLASSWNGKTLLDSNDLRQLADLLP